MEEGSAGEETPLKQLPAPSSESPEDSGEAQESGSSTMHNGTEVFVKVEEEVPDSDTTMDVDDLPVTVKEETPAMPDKPLEPGRVRMRRESSKSKKDSTDELENKSSEKKHSNDSKGDGESNRTKTSSSEAKEASESKKSRFSVDMTDSVEAKRSRVSADSRDDPEGKRKSSSGDPFESKRGSKHPTDSKEASERRRARVSSADSKEEPEMKKRSILPEIKEVTAQSHKSSKSSGDSKEHSESRKASKPSSEHREAAESRKSFKSSDHKEGQKMLKPSDFKGNSGIKIKQKSISGDAKEENRKSLKPADGKELGEKKPSRTSEAKDSHEIRKSFKASSDSKDPDCKKTSNDVKESLEIKSVKVEPWSEHEDKGNWSEEEFLGFDVPPFTEEESAARKDKTTNVPPLPQSRSGVHRASYLQRKSNLSNPAYLKPFEFNWMREVVFRNTGEVGGRRNADIYYYTPKKKKVRSFREVAEHLNSELTLANFTFFKEPIGLNDPAKEIVREAKPKNVSSPFATVSEDSIKRGKLRSATQAATQTSTTVPTTPSSSGSSKLSKPAEPTPSPKPAALTTTPRVVFKTTVNPSPSQTPSSTTSNPQVKISKLPTPKPSKPKADKKKKSGSPEEVNVEVMTPEKSNPSSDACNIECRLAMGLIPTLMCQKCRSLYHPECVTGDDGTKPRSAQNYICKKCQTLKSSPSKLPGGPSTVPPTSEPNPSNPPGESDAHSKNKKDTKAPSRPLSQETTTSNKPPQSSTSAPVVSEGNPQSLFTMKGKKYVLVTKHNVVNVTPNHNNGAAPNSSASNVTSNSDQRNGVNFTNPSGVVLVPCSVQQPANTEVQSTYVIVNNQGALPLHCTTGYAHPNQANGVKRTAESPVEGAVPPPEKKLKKDAKTSASNQPTNSVDERDRVPNHVTQHFMVNLTAGFSALLHAFKYLKVHELLRAGCVSKMWHHLTSHRSLWETVRMKNSRVRDWEGFGRALSWNGTRSLDLKKMLLPDTNEATSEMWHSLSKALATVPTLQKVDLGRCTPEAVELVASSCPQLTCLCATSIRGGAELDATPISKCVNLTELRLKGIGGFELKNISSLKTLNKLKHLSLTTVKRLWGVEEILPESLESLELGECTYLKSGLATLALPRMKNLTKLRLEKGQNDCPTSAILESVSLLPNLTQLELINFDIKPGFDDELAKCSNLRTLLIIPTYVTQSATTNHVVMGGVSKLSGSLTYFIWGLTLELLRVTDLFIDQVEGNKAKALGGQVTKKGNGDSIPILKPVEDTGESKEGSTTQSQVDILALPKLQRVLSTLLPTTKIKILKVPFSATWRQTVDQP